MERSLYRAVQARVQAVPLSAWPHFEAIARLCGVSFDTVFSIYSQEVQDRVRCSNKSVQAAMAHLAHRYLAGMLPEGAVCAAMDDSGCRHPAVAAAAHPPPIAPKSISHQRPLPWAAAPTCAAFPASS